LKLLTIEHDTRDRGALHDVTVREKYFVIKILASCEHLTYSQKNSFS